MSAFAFCLEKLFIVISLYSNTHVYSTCTVVYASTMCLAHDIYHKVLLNVSYMYPPSLP